MKYVALVGISGVGKSTFLKRCAEEVEFTHLEASSLIKEQKLLIQGTSATSEQLRTGAVLDNQDLLVSAFKRKSENVNRLCVLDGHTIIDTGSGFQKIPAEVFRQMRIKKFLVLQSEPEEVFSRREKDHLRLRPERTVADLKAYQELVKVYTVEIGEKLDVPVFFIDHSVESSVIDL